MPLKEKFDLNQARLAGIVQRVWSSGPDVLLRVRADERKEDRFTLLMRNGCAEGGPRSLMKGDHLSVSGHLIEYPYLETGRQFAEKARGSRHLLDAVPGLEEVIGERMATCLVVESMETNTEGSFPPTNEVILEGVVCKVWARSADLFARLAVYDPYTVTNGKEGKNGRPWRQAHYVSAYFPGGCVSGRAVSLNPKDRVRLSGTLIERRYSETLGLYLLRASQIGLLANAVNADEARAARVPRVSTYVQVETIIQFTR